MSSRLPSSPGSVPEYIFCDDGKADAPAGDAGAVPHAAPAHGRTPLLRVVKSHSVTGGCRLTLEGPGGASPSRGPEPKRRISRKEVFQPHLPVRLPCYDLAPVTCLTLGRSSRSRTSGTPGFHGLTGGVYKARERIHRAMADARLLANPASRSRVADSDPN